MRANLLKGLTKEQIEKVRACKSGSEILELAKKEGVELSDEQLAAVSGGACEPRKPVDLACPNCGTITSNIGDYGISDSRVECRCDNCGFVWHSLLK